MSEHIDKKRFDHLEKLFTKKCRSIARQFCTSEESAVAGYIFFKIGLNSLMALPAPTRLQMGGRVLDDVKPLFEQMQIDGKLIQQLSDMAKKAGEKESDKA